MSYKERNGFFRKDPPVLESFEVEISRRRDNSANATD